MVKKKIKFKKYRSPCIPDVVACGYLGGLGGWIKLQRIIIDNILCYVSKNHDELILNKYQIDHCVIQNAKLDDVDMMQ